VRREENVSAQQPAAQAHARVSGADAHPARSGGVVASAAQGAQAAERLSGGLDPAVVELPIGEQLRRRDRVRRSGEYLAAYRRGRRRSGALMTLHYGPNATGLPRLGVTVSRKVGNSVVRHRVKRRLVEVFRRAPLRAALPAWDFVVHVKPAAAAAAFADLRRELESLLGGVSSGARGGER
jgi:ribonuclease P protein component